MRTSEVEPPGHGSGKVTIAQTITFFVVNGEQRIRSVSTTNINFESSY